MAHIERARELRQRQTEAEALLWRHLRGRRLEGYKFRRQYPIKSYFVDFVCLSEKVIVELDGGHHASGDQERYDKERTRVLEQHGFRVLRFWNNQMFLETDAVLEVIVTCLRSPSPQPLSGRGLG